MYGHLFNQIVSLASVSLGYESVSVYTDNRMHASRGVFGEAKQSATGGGGARST
jgi:hypothetical protein